MKRIFGAPLNIFFLASLGLAVASAHTQERVLDDAAWRADITTVADAVQEFHPRPFRTISATEFQQQYESLLEDVPELSDKEVVVRLAALVALIDDGHTPTPGPEHATLLLQCRLLRLLKTRSSKH